MPRFSLHVEDDRHSPPTLRTIIVAGEARAKEWALKLMGASPHIGGVGSHEAGQCLLGVQPRPAVHRRRPRLTTIAEAPATDIPSESPTAAAEVSPPRKSHARTWAATLVDIGDFLLFLPLIPLMGLHGRARPDTDAVEPGNRAESRGVPAPSAAPQDPQLARPKIERVKG